MVPHAGLLAKLEHYGIDSKILLWITNFLNNRKQRVVVDGSFSNFADIESRNSFRSFFFFFFFFNSGLLTTDIATGFNQRKPPDRTVCVAVDLTAAFDTVCHNTLMSKIARSTLPSPTTRWLSCYLRGGQARTSCRGVKSSARIVHAGVPQGSKLSPLLFSFYLADMPRPTEPVKRVCYADDITVWASGVQIPVLEQQINSYLEEMSTYLKDNSLMTYNNLANDIQGRRSFDR